MAGLGAPDQANNSKDDASISVNLIKRHIYDANCQ